MLPGRVWLAEFIAEAEHSNDTHDKFLRYKSHPAVKSAEVVAEIKHEKCVFQLYGTTLWCCLQNPNQKVTPAFVTTTDLSDIALVAAEELGIRIEKVALRTDYPMIKCNINRQSGEKIYHLPFDQQYNKVKMDIHGECYIHSALEAEELGIRRAWRFKG